MPPKNRRKPSLNQTQDQNQSEPETRFFYEGDRLTRLLKSFHKQIETHKNSNKTLPEKLFIKQQFAVGVNEVTRILERMPPSNETRNGNGFAFPKLEAVMIASDCNPRWLTKHLPNLAASRNVPVILVKDNKEGSLRLGEIVRVKTAIAIGIKAKGSIVNEFVRRVVDENGDEWMEGTV